MVLAGVFRSFLRKLRFGRELERARARNREAAERLDAVVREVLKK